MKAAEIIFRAAQLVIGDRANAHGDIIQTHANIADLWNGYLRIRKDPASPLTATDVALMMVQLKVARTQLGALNMDDFTDLCGYGGVAGEIAHGVDNED